MARSSEIYDLIKQGEDQHLDFKQHISSAHKIARTIVAFANSEGGRIIIGVDDSGDVVGVDAEQEKYMMLQAGKKFCDPPVFIHFITMDDKRQTILIAEIEASEKEHRALDEFGEWLHYVRVRDQSVLVPDSEEQRHADKHNLKPIPIVMEESNGLLNYLKENEFITIKEYMKMMNISYGIAKRSLNDLVENKTLGMDEMNHTLHYYLRRNFLK
ncbi:MAG: putative DNA binding domain-containing protein [Chitinophagales bacterium]|nr:putative DNA binding domain-containing protein [Chitinophagales bacterium]